MGQCSAATWMTGVERPIDHRKLLPREERLCIAGEGIVTSLRHFSVNLIGRQFEIVTDHQPLIYLDLMKNSSPDGSWPYSHSCIATAKHRPGTHGLSVMAGLATDGTHCFAARGRGGAFICLSYLLYSGKLTHLQAVFATL